MRLMTYNTHACRGLDRRVDARRVARVIEREEPDVVALQELFAGTPLHHDDQLPTIAARLDMHYVFCDTFERGALRYGHALLSRWPLSVESRALLPGSRSTEPRAALWASIECELGRVEVITTHLSLHPRERLAQTRALLSRAFIASALETGPVVFAGDFNARPDRPAHRLTSEVLRDAWPAQRRSPRRRAPTWPALYPLFTLDYIFVSPHFLVERTWVSDTRDARLASDHLPLISELRLRS